MNVFAFIGATVIAPRIVGFPVSPVVFWTGVATLVFLVVTGGRVPSYLGASFSFLAPIAAVTAYSGQGENLHMASALGGIIAAGVLYALVGVIIMIVGYQWLVRLMPPVVTGAIVAAVGLNLAPAAVNDMAGGNFAITIGLLTTLAVALSAVYAPGLLRRLPILVGGVLGYLIYLVAANGYGWGPAIDFSPVTNAAWLGWPQATSPTFDLHDMTRFAPVVLILMGENLGHVLAVGTVTGRDMTRYIGRAFLGDGLGTIFSGFRGGMGATTYGENISTMGLSKVYSTAVYMVAAFIAMAIGLCPKFGALVATIPNPVLGGLSLVLFGMIAAIGARIWVDNKVDFSRNCNLITVAVALTMGAGNFAITVNGFSVGGIGTAAISAILAYALLSHLERTAPATVAGEASS
jgi:putative pyrimidine permease RutG